jgi:hypothetical protein
MRFIRRSLAPLNDWKYVSILYLSGSATLGSIGYFLNLRGLPIMLSVWIVVMLVAPFHLALYGIWDSYRESIRHMVELETRLLQSYGTQVPDAMRQELERRSRDFIWQRAVLAFIALICIQGGGLALFDAKDLESGHTLLRLIGEAAAVVALVLFSLDSLLRDVFFRRGLLFGRGLNGSRTEEPFDGMQGRPRDVERK